MKSVALVLVASVLSSLGAVCLKLGAPHLNRSPLSLLNRQLIFGVALFLGSSVFYAFGIRDGQLSVLNPMAALGYIWTLVWARLFFQETVTKQKFLGLGLILLGVFFVGIGS